MREYPVWMCSPSGETALIPSEPFVIVFQANGWIFAGEEPDHTGEPTNMAEPDHIADVSKMVEPQRVKGWPKGKKRKP